MLGKINYKSFLIFSTLLFAAFVFSLPYSPIYESLRYDREVYQYFGMIIHEGLIPYIDAFDHKPPLIYLLNYLGFSITPNSTWGIYIIQNFMAFFSSYLVYYLAKKKLKSIILPVLISIIYLSIMNSNILLSGGNHTRQFASFFTVWLMFIVFGNRKSKLKQILVGVLIGLIFVTQQNEILSGLVLVFYYLVFQKEFKVYSYKRIFENFIHFGLGLLIPLASILFLLVYWNTFDNFINQAFLVNLNDYIQINSYFNHIFNTIKEYYSIVIEHKVLLLVISLSAILIIANIITYRKNRIHSGLAVLGIAFIFQILSTSISGNTWGHYFLMFTPYVIYFLIFSISLDNHSFIKLLSYPILIITVLYFVKNIVYQTPDRIFLGKITKEVESVNSKPGQFYSLHARYIRVNFELNIISPSKYVYIPHFYPKEFYNNLIDDFNSHNTRYILYDNNSTKYPEELYKFIKHNYKEMFSYKQDDYNNFTLFERKSK